jgi:hypothetical protein
MEAKEIMDGLSRLVSDDVKSKIHYMVAQALLLDNTVPVKFDARFRHATSISLRHHPA